MKVGIVVPYSWSFWGAVVEHAELQAVALQRLGIETRTIMGNDPPGSFTRVLHPRSGRHGEPPPDVIPVGRSVIVPANGSLPNIVLSPGSVGKIRRALERERFDLLHLHEPMTPAICIATLALARVPVVATFHAHGALGWMKFGKPLWGFLADRLDARIAVSAHARDTAEQWLPGEYHVVPNGVLMPEHADKRALIDAWSVRFGEMVPGAIEGTVAVQLLHDRKPTGPETRVTTGGRVRVTAAGVLPDSLAPTPPIPQGVRP